MARQGAAIATPKICSADRVLLAYRFRSIQGDVEELLIHGLTIQIQLRGTDNRVINRHIDRILSALIVDDVLHYEHPCGGLPSWRPTRLLDHKLHVHREKPYQNHQYFPSFLARAHSQT